MLGLRCCTGLSLDEESGDYSLVVVHTVLIVVAVFGCRTRALGRLGSVAAAPGLYSTDSVVVVHGLVKKCSILPAALQAFLHSPCFLSNYCLIAHNVKSKYENETFTHTSKVLLRISCWH